MGQAACWRRQCSRWVCGPCAMMLGPICHVIYHSHLNPCVSPLPPLQAVQRLVAGRTVLVIAHRLSTVQVGVG